MKKYHFDLIIANPPYGKIGADITKQVIDNIGFKEYVNLMPVSDYTRVQNLTKHISLIKVIKRGAFDDAAVTPAIANLSSTEVNDKLPLEIVCLAKDAGLMTNYLVANAKAGVPYTSYSQYDPDIASGKVNSNCLLSLGHRDFANGHLAYSKTRDYAFNVGELSLSELLKQATHSYGNHTVWGSDIYTFNSEQERNNFRDFMYSADGYRFYSYIFSKAQVDSTDARLYVFPKVDWTRSWTVQEILKEYNYTNEEIAQVMEELKKYKLGEMHQD